MLETVDLIEKGKVQSHPQNDSEASPAPKIAEELCKIDWSKPADEINNLIRGLSPQPGAFTFLRGKILKIYRARPESNVRVSTDFGKIITADKKNGFTVQAGSGILRLKELQLEGKKKLSVEEFLRGYRIEAGERLE